MAKNISDAITILVVEDDLILNRSICKVLENEGFKSEGYHSGSEVLSRRFAPGESLLLLLDYTLPDMKGKDVVAILRECGKKVPFIIITGHGDEQLAVDMMKMGAMDYIVKTVQFHELAPVKIRHAVEEIGNKRQLENIEKSLRESEEKYRTLVERASDGIIIVQDGIVEFANAGMAQIDGTTVGQVVGTNFSDHIDQSERPRVMDQYTRRMAGERVPQIYETVLKTSAGLRVSAELNAGIISYRGKPADLIFVRDITARKLAETALKTSEAKYSKLYEAMMDASVSINMEGYIVEYNSAFQALLGYSDDELRRVTYVELTPDKWHVMEEEIVRNQIIARGYSDIYEKEYRRKDGVIFPVELRTILTSDEAGRPSGMWAIVRDISERKRMEGEKAKLEEQLRQSQKLEAIGQLASGVAHDFNNLLGGIMGNAELMQSHKGEDRKIEKFIGRILDSSEKAADLTKQLLMFARKAPVNFAKVDVHSSILNVISLLRHTIDRRIEIATQLNACSSKVDGDRNQLENAILNIAINARDAMPEGGTLSFSTKNINWTDNNPVASRDNAPQGSFIRVAISDSGIGMDKKTMERIFEPFFTTKEAGRGTGLGLAAVYGSVKQHNGTISVESEQGKGTTFSILLPVAPAGQDGGEPAKESPVTGKGTVMILDDEEIVAATTSELVCSLGYEPVFFCDCFKAISHYAEHHSEIDAVVLDLVMPKMNGLAVFRSLKKANKGVRAVIASGYSDEKLEKQVLEEGPVEIIRKPYNLVELSRALSKAVTTAVKP